MKQKNKMLSTHGIKTLFETRLTQLTSLASESQDETAFKNYCCPLKLKRA